MREREKKEGGKRGSELGREEVRVGGSQGDKEEKNEERKIRSKEGGREGGRVRREEGRVGVRERGVGGA